MAASRIDSGADDTHESHLELADEALKLEILGVEPKRSPGRHLRPCKVAKGLLRPGHADESLSVGGHEEDGEVRVRE